ncbi:MAG: amidinotransferase [Bacteroidetes bacterium]|nr:amidinotransferase [Bacteroidota bacterium]
MKQCASTVCMVRPGHFGYNMQTASSNKFQVNTDTDMSLVMTEFDHMYHQLINAGIEVFVFDDKTDVITPDSIFLNNWFAMLHNQNAFIFPMMAENRRHEKRNDIIETLAKKHKTQTIEDWSRYEKSNEFLEGTGSMVLDHVNAIAYASLSERTHEQLFLHFCSYINYKPVTFRTFIDQFPIYHTNVVMSVGEKFAVLGSQSFLNASEERLVKHYLKVTDKELIEITNNQVMQYCGNILQLQDKYGDKKILLSAKAKNAFTPEQLEILEKHGELLVCNVDTIETIGGGSVRCMVAEVF